MGGGGGFKIPWGFNLPYRGSSVFNKGVQYTMDVNRPQVQFTMGFKIPYDTGVLRKKKFFVKPETEAKNILSTILVMHKKNENNKGCFLLFVIN